MLRRTMERSKRGVRAALRFGLIRVKRKSVGQDLGFDAVWSGPDC